jgi:hypothetical protein
MNYALDDEVLLIKGRQSFLLVAKVKNRFGLCIETTHDEYVQGVEYGDLVVVSAPEDGAIEPALMLIELVRSFHVPLLVLPKDHPGSKRISYVVSVGPEIFTSCSIQRGTIRISTLYVRVMSWQGSPLRKVSMGSMYPLYPQV